MTAAQLKAMWRVWGREEVCTGFWWGNLMEGGQWGDPGADGRIILRLIFRKWDLGVMDWINMPQGRERWRALVNGVINLRIPLNAGNFWTS